MRARHPLCVAATAVALLLPGATARAEATTTRCKSADLRYPFEPGGPKTFGVFRLRITDGSCGTAHRVAKEWMDRFEGELLRGHVRLPRSVFGFRFTTLAPTEAQSYNERGRKGAATIRFIYRVPNG
jgi:hypothetical protein